MVYFANFDTYNFCLRGTTSLLCGPEAQGMYNGNFVACFGWPYWNTANINSGLSSWSKYILQCQLPYVSTVLTGTTNAKIDSHLRFQGRPFSLNLDGGMGIAAVGFTGTNPANAGGTNLGLTYMQGYKHLALSSRGNGIGISATAAYSFTFANWRLGSSSGTVLTSTANVTLYYNSTYGGVNFKDIALFTATAS